MPRGSKHWKNFVVLACLSRSITSTRRECFSARMQARLQAVTDLPTPPFKLMMAILLMLRIVILLVAYLLVFIFSAAIW